MRDPRGYILPANQADFPTAVRFVDALLKSGVAVHRLRDGDQLVEVKLAAGGRPVEAGYYKADKPVMVIRYDAFERGLPADPKLFARPEGFTYVEKRPGQ